MSSRPFFPSEFENADLLRDWRRRATALAVGKSGSYVQQETVARLWPADRGAFEAIEKAAVTPTSLSGSGAVLGAIVLGAFLQSLAPRSAAARLFEAATRVDMTGIATVGLPGSPTRFTAPAFVSEGGVIPVNQGSFATAILGPPSKLAAISVVTSELSAYSAERAESIVSLAMEEGAAYALDGAVFSATAASSIRPAGLLNGVTGITATTGGGITAMAGDLRNLVGGIADAAGGANIMIFANPRQAVSLSLFAGPGFLYPVIPTPALAAGTLVAIEAGAIASGFAGLPEISTATETVLHFEDASPQPIGTVGSPNVVAAPARSTWQSDMIAIRLILRCAWAARKAGAVQFVAGATW